MNAIDAVLRQPIAQAIGWALLQFVWQGAALAAITAVVLAALRRSAADVRYVVATISLALMFTMPAVTAVQSWRAAAPVVSQPSLLAGEGGASRHLAGGDTPVRPVTASAGDVETTAAGATDAPLSAWIPGMLVVWALGVCVLSLRLASEWLWVQRMKSHRATDAAERWQQAAAKLARRLHIARPVALLESTAVEVPTVIGWLKPVVLLPASVIAGLSPQQIEAILAHELAHVRRHDYLVNLLQTLVETLLFYHPAVWWLSRRIRAERENCCDDLAVSLCGDPYSYARALADLEELRGRSGQLALAATGGALLRRVRRLVGSPTHAGRGPGWLAGVCAILLIAGLAAGALGNVLLARSADRLDADQVEPDSDSATTAAASAVEVHTDTRGAASAVEAAAQVVATAPSVPTVDVSPVLAPATPLAPLPFDDLASPEVAPAPPTPPEPPAPPARGVEYSVQSDDVGRRRSTFSWSDGREKLQVDLQGEIEFTDDDSDVKRLSPGGRLKISDGGWFTTRVVEFRADASGGIERRFRVGMAEKPFEPEGRQWLAQMLPRFIRQTAIGAPARVARILKAQGPSGVLEEISRIEGSWAKRVYFTELLQGGVDAQTARRVLAQAGREIDSDFELASLLINSANQLVVDDATRQAYLEAVRTIGSDFEMRRVFASALKAGPVPPALLAGILSASVDIDSDFEEATLLTQVAKLQPLDAATRGPFFKALATVGSDFEHRRVLSALADRHDLSVETVAAMLESSASIESDFEQASWLAQIVKGHPIDGPLRAPFFNAVETIGSAFERGRVLKAVINQRQTPPDTIVSVLRAAKAMTSGFETSQVLQAVAAQHPVTGEARELYIDAAERLGDFEQGRALAALVKNERRK